MAKRTDFHDYVMQDLMAGIRGVTSRAMFGGWALHRDGVTFGIIADGQLFFKVDERNRKDYQGKGSEPFVYESRGKKVIMKSYWEVPAEVQEDRETLERWITASCRAAKKGKQRPGPVLEN